MKLEHEDPRVIDYVLGELPEDERKAIRAALAEAENAEAAAFARELGGVSLLSVATLQAEAKANVALAESPTPERQYRPERNWSPWNPSVVRLMKGLTFASVLVMLPLLAMSYLFPRVGGGRVLTGLNQMDNMTESRLSAGKKLYDQDQFHEALSEFDAALKTDPDNAEAKAYAKKTSKKLDLAFNHPDAIKPMSFDASDEPTEGEQAVGISAMRIADASSVVDLSVPTAPEAKLEPEAVTFSVGSMLPPEGPGFGFPPAPVSAPAPASPPAEHKAETAMANAEAPERPSSLQNVEVGGGIRIRDNWIADRLENGPKSSETSSNPPALYQSYIEPEDQKHKLQLQALGYGAASDGDGIHESGGFGSTYPQGGLGGGFGGGAPRPALQLTLPITFKSVLAEPLSTFAADVDTASYTLIRRDLQGGQLPAPQRVRTEEFINYFDYAYPEPTGEHPFSVTVDVAACPWAPTHRLARVGIRGKAMDAQERVAANLVFLVDVSGSMDSPDKLPLVRESLRGLLETLKESDRVALVTYAGESRVVLEPTSCEQKDKIRAAIDSLGAGGSTNGAGGITAAYEQARRAFIEKGINRVLIATDGDFNVGVTSQQELENLITQQAKSGVFLSVLGYGTGNLNDTTLETLADKGNGFYAYIDDIGEARRVLVEKGLSAIATIAKDVKFQIEFNPAKVGHYRQIGYENRQLAAQDFNDDTKDAGDIGPGHTVTALYELVPAGQSPTPGVDPLKYQQTEPAPVANNSPESMTVKLRYKQPEAQTSQLLEVPVLDAGTAFDAATQDFRFASAVAAFAQVLKGLQLAEPPTLEQIRTIADSTKGNDPARQEFVDLVVTTKTLVR
jgi:secreted protein with Ig-like and vWFA domain/tetratricopeptide (TPR) repeat protein